MSANTSDNRVATKPRNSYISCSHQKLRRWWAQSSRTCGITVVCRVWLTGLFVSADLVPDVYWSWSHRCQRTLPTPERLPHDTTPRGTPTHYHMGRTTRQHHKGPTTRHDHPTQPRSTTMQHYYAALSHDQYTRQYRTASTPQNGSMQQQQICCKGIITTVNHTLTLIMP